MKYKHLLYGWLVTVFFFINTLVYADNMTVNFSEVHGQGLTIEKDGEIPLNRIQLNKIRVDIEVMIQNPFGESRTIVVTDYYDLLFKSCLSNDDRRYLIPILTAEEPICEKDNLADLSNSTAYGVAPDSVQLDVVTDDRISPIYFKFNLATLTLVEESIGCGAMQIRVLDDSNGQPLAFARIMFGELVQSANEEGLINFDHLLPGRWQIGAAQDGYETQWQEFEVLCDLESPPLTVLEMRLPLLPPPRQVRISLDWTDDRVDFDAHLTGPDPGALGNYNNELDRFHVYFGNKTTGCWENGCVAAIHYSDELLESKPETIMVLPPAGSDKLRPGIYRYAIHQFDGKGSLLEAGVQVRLQIGDQSELVFTPPPLPEAQGELTGDKMDMWRVFRFEVMEDGMVKALEAKKDYLTAVNPNEVN